MEMIGEPRCWDDKNGRDVGRTRTVKTDDSVGEIGVETHSRSESDRQIGEKSHAEGGQGGDGGCSSDEITLDLLDTKHVLWVGDTQVCSVLGRIVTNTVTTTFRNDSC